MILDDWLNDDQCKILHHELKDVWWHFQVCDKNNESDFKWLKHQKLKHLKVYKSYLKNKTDLTLEDVTTEQYIVEKIIDHQYKEETNDMEYLIKWKGFGEAENSWEPPNCLMDNIVYIKYCKQKGLIPLRSDDNYQDFDFSFDSEDDQRDHEEMDSSSEDEEEEEIEIEIESESEFEIGSLELDTNRNNRNNKSITSDIDINSEYDSARKHNKIHTLDQLILIISRVEYEIYALLELDNDEHNQKDLNYLMDMKQYFEAQKSELLQQMKFQGRDGQNHNHNKSQNVIIEISDDDDIEIPDKFVPNSMDNKTKTPRNNNKKRTLFDYDFTPKSKNDISGGSNISNKNKTIQKIKRRKKTSLKLKKNLFGAEDDGTVSMPKLDDNDDIPSEYIQKTSVCYVCCRKWHIRSIEYMKAFPICNKCPSHIRLGHERYGKEDWFCPSMYFRVYPTSETYTKLHFVFEIFITQIAFIRLIVNYLMIH